MSFPFSRTYRFPFGMLNLPAKRFGQRIKHHPGLSCWANVHRSGSCSGEEVLGCISILISQVSRAQGYQALPPSRHVERTTPPASNKQITPFSNMGCHMLMGGECSELLLSLGQPRLQVLGESGLNWPSWDFGPGRESTQGVWPEPVSVIPRNSPLWRSSHAWPTLGSKKLIFPTTMRLGGVSMVSVIGHTFLCLIFCLESFRGQRDLQHVTSLPCYYSHGKAKLGSVLNIRKSSCCIPL